MGDMERAAQALRTGATLPPEASPVLADLLESHHTVAVGKHPPKGWLMVDMAAIDMARAITGERTDPQRDRGNAIEALWKDRGVQDCFKRSREYQLNDSAR